MILLYTLCDNTKDKISTPVPLLPLYIVPSKLGPDRIWDILSLQNSNILPFIVLDGMSR